jgi:alpha-glucuronidase
MPMEPMFWPMPLNLMMALLCGGAFVYDNKVPDDRTKQAYNEFKPLDGKFRSNVIVQVKNGPLDFQPREPFHPLFGAMKHTPLMMEFQITQSISGKVLTWFITATYLKKYWIQKPITLKVEP